MQVYDIFFYPIVNVELNRNIFYFYFVKIL